MGPTPVFFFGEFHGQRSLAYYSLWGRKELDTTEWLNTFTFLVKVREEGFKRAVLSSNVGVHVTGGGGLVAKLRPPLVTPRTVVFQAPLSMGFSRQVFLSGLPFVTAHPTSTLPLPRQFMVCLWAGYISLCLNDFVRGLQSAQDDPVFHGT